MDYFNRSVVKIIPFLLFCIHGALGLISISFKLIDCIKLLFLLNITYFNCILGRQKDNLNDTLPYL